MSTGQRNGPILSDTHTRQTSHTPSFPRFPIFILFCFFSFKRSMSAAPRHHQNYMTPDFEGQILQAVQTLAQAFGAGNCRCEWRGPSRQNRQRWRGLGQNKPRLFARAPTRGPFPRTREPSLLQPRHFGQERRSNWQRPLSNAPCPTPPRLEKPPMPRRGPPVAAIRAPRWYRPRGVGKEAASWV